MFRLFSLVLTALTSLAAASGAPPQVSVSVYYESLCPDSIKFFTSQLYPTYTSSVKPRLNLTLIPYGKSIHRQENGEYVFECHHGPNECYGNKVQACAIKKLTDQPKLMALLNCLMGSALADRNGTYPINKCAETTGITSDDIVSCANSTDGSRYLAELGDLTNALNPKLTSVPTIVVNGTFTDANQKQALINLRGLVCSLIAGEKPTDCATESSASVTASISALLIVSVAKLL